MRSIDIKNPIVKSSDHFADLWQRLAIATMQSLTVPFDLFCPSIQKDLEKRQCTGCKQYFASVAAVTQHGKGNGCAASLGIQAPLMLKMWMKWITKK